jgi:hypothetical protein
MPKYIPCKYTYASKDSKCGQIQSQKNKTLHQNVLNGNTVTSKAQLLHNMFKTGKMQTNYVRDTPTIVTHQFGNTYNTGLTLTNRPFSTSEFK